MDVIVKTDWTVGNLIEFQQKQILRVNHEYQRGLRWTLMQKQMFIDSVFRGYSIPAFYFHKKETSALDYKTTQLEIVDGQQRIDAIYGFSEGAFPLLDPTGNTNSRFPSFVKNDPCPWGGKRFDELSEQLQNQLKKHEIVVYEITTENENTIRDLFIRLQGGTPLTPQDRRDSWPGNFTEYVLRVGGKSEIDKWFGFDLFKTILKKSQESQRRQLVAQSFMLYWSVRNENGFCDIKSANIDQFYHSNVDFDDSSDDAKQFERICKRLESAFDGKPRSVLGHHLIHLILFTDSLLQDYADGWEPDLAHCLNTFDQKRKKTAEDVRNRRETEDERFYTEYGRWTQTRSDDGNSIRRRHAFFAEEMLKLLSPDKLDTKRQFSNLERKTVFFRDMELCQWCKMKDIVHRVFWDECEIHHVTKHADGGKTIVENGALVHRDCHPKMKKEVEVFEQWWLEHGYVARDLANVSKSS